MLDNPQISDMNTMSHFDHVIQNWLGSAFRKYSVNEQSIDYVVFHNQLKKNKNQNNVRSFCGE